MNDSGVLFQFIRKSGLGNLVILPALVFFPELVFSTDVSLTNTAGDNWSTAANWDTRALPGTADNGFISIRGIVLANIT